MPSPFPGMDPYLEGDLWTSVHHALAIRTMDQLAPILEPRYVALSERYSLFDTGQEEVEIATANFSPDMAIAQASQLPHYRVAIQDVASRRSVTVVEFLSPVSKRGEGRTQYLRKRKRFLDSSTHLIEVDMLRKGTRAPLEEEYAPGNYFIVVSRANKRLQAEVWPVFLSQPLPTIPLPLLKGDADVPLDMQQVMTALYDLGRFKYLIDYRKPPDAPLKRHIVW